MLIRIASGLGSSDVQPALPQPLFRLFCYLSSGSRIRKLIPECGFKWLSAGAEQRLKSRMVGGVKQSLTERFGRCGFVASRTERQR
jgi:hypothetical protein